MWHGTTNAWARILAIALVLCLMALVAGKVWLDATYFDGYDPKAPLHPQVVVVEERSAYTWTKFYYAGAHGDRVPAVMATPRDSPAPFPCVVFLHGIGNDKEFMARNRLDEPFVKAGFAFVCFDQLMRGERKQKGGLHALAAFRIRASRTVNDTRRLIDYLVTRPDIATNRIYLCGASYGAMTGSTATAFDPRICAAVLVYGGGSVTKLLSSPAAAEEAGKWRHGLRLLAWYFSSVWDPVRHVAAISPRPVLIQNGKADTVIPPECARALQNAALEPKTIKWYEGDHLGKTRELDLPVVHTVLADAVEFLKEQDARRSRGLSHRHDVQTVSANRLATSLPGLYH
ncbi:MAG TPA: dienelactone hydrolase family protein [Verrucomicrobiota bacterium]|nr:dienelactone hydrolase family protein [Verrucomicrobiota bacterium]HNU50736.1 dienelactone hydrolase family protein [Verrucomicrobiota bacterium]